jgi:phosphoglycolate phosphatase-like HAD superfamily hydrolase
MPALLETYVTYLHDELRRNPAGVHLMPGVTPLIDVLHQRTDLILGLLTGNLAEGANAKLSAAGIDPRLFRVGAFGSDHEIRGELPAVAQRRARETLGHDIAGRDVVVIGDTPSDLQCGRSIGARAIGVATGRFSVDELWQHDPAAVFANFTDTNAVVEAIVGDNAPYDVADHAAVRDR